MYNLLLSASTTLWPQSYVFIYAHASSLVTNIIRKLECLESCLWSVYFWFTPRITPHQKNPVNINHKAQMTILFVIETILKMFQCISFMLDVSCIISLCAAALTSRPHAVTISHTPCSSIREPISGQGTRTPIIYTMSGNLKYLFRIFSNICNSLVLH